MSKECIALLAAKDRSAVVLSKYVPSVSLDGWLALRAWNVETQKIVDSAKEPTVSLARLQYWKSAVQQCASSPEKVLNGRDPAPVALLASAIAGGAQIPKRYLLTLVQTREHQLTQPPLRTTDDLARQGEGTASQILYATFDMLQARESGTAEYLACNAELDELASTILAHIGQAQGIASALRAAVFYARKHGRLLLPSQVLSAHYVVEQQVLNEIEENKPGSPQLRDAVFEVATAANDHVLTARLLMDQFKEQTGTVPSSLGITSMAAVPIVLYLERLQKLDFNILAAVPREWRLPWRSWRTFKTKRF